MDLEKGEQPYSSPCLKQFKTNLVQVMETLVPYTPRAH